MVTKKKREEIQRILVGKSIGKRPLGIPRTRDNNIKMVLMEINFKDGMWMKLAQDRI